jgi:hypothetical protein
MKYQTNVRSNQVERKTMPNKTGIAGKHSAQVKLEVKETVVKPENPHHR